MKKESGTNSNKIVLFIAFTLVCWFGMFLASSSFAKYVDKFEEEQNVRIATPYFKYNRDVLKRYSTGIVDENGNPLESYEYELPIFDKDPVVPFDGIKPEDDIQYYFSISNQGDKLDANGDPMLDENGHKIPIKNQVSLEFTIKFTVYLKEILTNPNSEAPTAQNERNYFQYGANLFKDYGGQMFFGEYGGTGPLEDFGSYKAIAFDTAEKFELFKPKDHLYEGDYINTKNETGSNVERGVAIHTYKFVMDVNDPETLKHLAIRVLLPSQHLSGDAFETARLYIEVDVTASQVGPEKLP